MIRGLLADVNVAGHLAYLNRLLHQLDLVEVMASGSPFRFVTFRELGLANTLPDRQVWHYCQLEGWILLTDNRNHDDADSLAAVIGDSWQDGHLPVLTIANKDRFEHDLHYAAVVARDAADIIYGLLHTEENRDQPRIFVPRK